MTYKTPVFTLFVMISACLGYYEATVTWQPSTHPSVTEMRIYQVSQTGENIAGYHSFGYSDLSGTFKILNGCVEVFGRAYTNDGRLSEPSNVLALPCTCQDCQEPAPPYSPDDGLPPLENDDGRITGITGRQLSFNAGSSGSYDVFYRTSLTSGSWEYLKTVYPAFDGTLDIQIDTSERDSCYYTVIPR